MSTAGRPSSYRPEYCQLAHNYCLLGATNARLGEFFGVTSRTIDNWIATIPEFRDEVQRGRNMADAQVSESLYQRAVGYSHTVERVIGRPGHEQIIRYKKSYPPQTAACKHWLRNRRPQNWGGRVRPARQVAADAKTLRVPQAANGNESRPVSIVEQNDGVDRRPASAPALRLEAEPRNRTMVAAPCPAPRVADQSVAGGALQGLLIVGLVVLPGASRSFNSESQQQAGYDPPMGPVLLEPGAVPLAAWRDIYRGLPVTLDPLCHGAIDASARAIATILGKGEPVYGINTGFGKLASVRIAAADLERLQRNIVLSHAAGVGPPMPVAIVRLMMALKLASLAQGASGVRRETVAMLEGLLARDLVPIVPAQGSVGASGDLAPLAHMTAAMIGVGAFFVDGAAVPAERALADAGLTPLVLGAKEGLALLNGTQFSTAYALAGLFEAETLFNSALVTGALATDAARGSDAPFDPRIHELRRHAGQIEAARALRRLMEGSAIRVSHLVGDERVQDPYCLRCQPQVMGAVLDLLRHVAATLGTEANGVTDNPLIFAETGEALSGGNFHAEPVAFAADILALALCEIGSLAERRIAMLVDPALSGLPAFLTPRPGLNSGFMIPQVTAAALVAENKQRAHPASVDSIPTSANQEDHVSMAAHGARRLMDMADNCRSIVGIELLAAAQGCDFHEPLRSSPSLEAVRELVRRHVPHLEDDRHFHPDLARAADLVGRNAVVDAIAPDILPSLDRSPSA